jgi:hypothetical protein
MGITVVIWTLPLCGDNINQNEALEPTCTQFVQLKRPILQAVEIRDCRLRMK